MCGDVRAGAGNSPAGAKESRLAREGVGPDSDQRARQSGSGHPALCSLAVCWQGGGGGGGLELLTPSVAKLERARACRKMTLIPNYPPKPSALGGPVCLCSVCACRSLCACLLSRTVLRAPVPQLSTQAASLLWASVFWEKGGVSGFKGRREMPRWPRRGIWCPGKRRGPWGEESLLCQIPKCHWGHVCGITISLPGQRPA